MKIFKAITFFILAIMILNSACSSSKTNVSRSKVSSPVSKDLYDTIAYMDSIFFNAFNTRDINTVTSMLSENLEFYHDMGGVTNFEQNIEAFKRTFANERRVRRELLKNVFEVHPIKDFGAVETGVHRFYATEKGQQEKLSSEARFLQVWQRKDGKWKLTRIISYGHDEYLK